MSSDPLDFDALGQAALVAKGEVSPALVHLAAGGRDSPKPPIAMR